MDNDLMDSWVNCVYGVDCETHRQALSEIQQLRDDLNAAPDLDEMECHQAEAETFLRERDAMQEQLDAERAKSANLLKTIHELIANARAYLGEAA